MRLLPAIVISLGAAAVGHAAEIAPGAVVSGDGRTVYLRVPQGALEARSVEQGGVLWRAPTTCARSRPWAAACCASARRSEGRLDLVFLDAASGRPLAATAFALPARASRRRSTRCSGPASTCARSRTGPRVLLVWRFERRPVRGAHFEEEHGEDGDESEGDEVLRAEGAGRSRSRAGARHGRRGSGGGADRAAARRRGGHA